MQLKFHVIYISPYVFPYCLILMSDFLVFWIIVAIKLVQPCEIHI